MDAILIDEKDDSLVFDLKKIFATFNSHKLLLVGVFVLIALVMICATLFLPKKYTAKIELLMNNTSSTNLSEFNPFLVTAGTESRLPLSDFVAKPAYLAIIRSPLVMDKVIKDNDIRYKKGKKQGELVSAEDFLRNNIKITLSPDTTGLVEISYTSGNPETVYNVLASIIKNYQMLNHELNMKRAGTDKAFLEEMYNETYANVNNLIKVAGRSAALPETQGAGNIMALAAIKGYSSAASTVVAGASRQYETNKRAEVGLAAEVEKLKTIKARLEWIKSVEQMSEASSNMVVLQEPVLKKDFEYSFPLWKVNALITIFLTIFMYLFVILFKHFFGTKVEYSMLGDKIVYGLKNIDDLKIILLANAAKKVGVVVFDNNDKFLAELGNFKNVNILKPEMSPEFVKDLNASEDVVLVLKAGKTSRKSYLKMKNLLIELHKKDVVEMVC